MAPSHLAVFRAGLCGTDPLRVTICEAAAKKRFRALRTNDGAARRGRMPPMDSQRDH
jgi:hypothetical protein